MAPTIGQWLEALGLSQYADAFVENGVEFDLLPEIDNDDLKDLGVSRLVDRKRILKAIVEQQMGDAGTVPQDASETGPSTAISHEAERRQLTVMFVDLVGSTALSGRLDPEDMREAITAYQNTVAGIVTRYDGHVAKYMGDGVLCYFGWPRAHEDDAERAVRASLAVTQGLNTSGQQPRRGSARRAVFSGRHRDGQAAKRKVVGAPRQSQPCTSLGQCRGTPEGPGFAGTDLWLVHGRLRHARSDGRESAARRARVMFETGQSWAQIVGLTDD